MFIKGDKLLLQITCPVCGTSVLAHIVCAGCVCMWYVCLPVNELNMCVYVCLQHEADSALRKARLLQAQRQEEYEKAKVSTSRLEEEQIAGGGGAAAAKQLEKRRRLEEEALQKVQHLLCSACGSF